MTLTFGNLAYSGSEAQTTWNGVALQQGEHFDAFYAGSVVARLYDSEGRGAFEAHVQGLTDLTNFGKENLERILDAEHPEERDWAIGEALAEALLATGRGVIWPWNMERDKRNPHASLPGADLLGFIPWNGTFRFVFGEVKSSSQAISPPQVMSGRGGLTHQLDSLATNLTSIYQLLFWLHIRCKNTEFEGHFTEALVEYCNSGNRSAELVGILIRDTPVNELDLKARGIRLGASIQAPCNCSLVAVYLPHAISDLPQKVRGGAS